MGNIDGKIMKIIEIRGANYKGKVKETLKACRAVIVNNGNILLARDLKFDQYMIPGGLMEDNETEEQCVTREVSAYTGEAIEVVTPFIEIHEFYGTTEWIGKYFIARSTGRSVVNEKKEQFIHLECEWMNFDKALKMFSEYKSYFAKDPIKSGLYLREYNVLKNVK
jgi:NADH pyrophosphatase NudC (nudix superfamily)